MNRLQRSSFNIIFSAAGWAVPALLNFLSTPILLKLLGEAAYGLQTLVAVVIGYLTVMDMGLDIPVTKFLAEDHARGDSESENRLLNTTLQLYTGIGIVGMVIIMLAADVLARRVFEVPDELIRQAVVVFRLAGVGFLASVMSMWGKAIANGLQRYDVASKISIAANLAGVTIGLAAVYAGYGVTGYVFIRVLVSLLTGVAYLISAHQLIPGFRLRLAIDMPILQRVKSYASFGLILRLTGLIVGGLDRTLIGAWLGVAAVALYAVPALVSAAFSQLIGNMLHFIFPMASELYSTNQFEALQNIFIRSMRFVAGLATAMIVPLLVLGDLFLNLWIGPNVTVQSAAVLRLLLLTAYFQAVAAVLTNNFVVGTGRISVFSVYATINGLVVGAGCLLFIRPFGIQGAGLAQLISEAVDIIFMIFVVQRYLQISPLALFRTAYLRPLLLGLAIGALAFLARPIATSWIGLSMVVGCLEIIYLVVGYQIGVFSETEARAAVGLWQAMSKLMRRAGA
ncbi:MAG: oligosaccharide flippase family protein [Chloroflexi bacterium]|nr:oligosaccharide flippase family protein [Chloroflexota bacterium]